MKSIGVTISAFNGKLVGDAVFRGFYVTETVDNIEGAEEKLLNLIFERYKNEGELQEWIKPGEVEFKITRPRHKAD
jgi:hypothetical protein